MYRMATVTFENSNRFYTYGVLDQISGLERDSKAIVLTPRGFQEVLVHKVWSEDSLEDLELGFPLSSLKYIYLSGLEWDSLVQTLRIADLAGEREAFLTVLVNIFGEDFTNYLIEHTEEV